ncbi:hypothetical protein IAU59_006504 [Kwoniella sp. CBS 9459]
MLSLDSSDIHAFPGGDSEEVDMSTSLAPASAIPVDNADASRLKDPETAQEPASQADAMTLMDLREEYDQWDHDLKGMSVFGSFVLPAAVRLTTLRLTVAIHVLICPLATHLLDATSASLPANQ